MGLSRSGNSVLRFDLSSCAQVFGAIFTRCLVMLPAVWVAFRVRPPEPVGSAS